MADLQVAPEPSVGTPTNPNIYQPPAPQQTAGKLPYPNVNRAGPPAPGESWASFDGFSSDAAYLWGLEQSGANIEALRATEKNAYDDMTGQIAKDPTILPRFQGWASAVPSLPGGALLSLTQAGVEPNSELGQWIIRSAVPALQQKSPTPPQDVAGIQAIINDPDKLAAFKNLPLAQQQNLMSHGVETAGRISDDQLTHLEQTGHLPDQGVAGYIGDLSRPAFAVLQSGYEALQASARQQIATPAASDPTGYGLQAGAAKIAGKPAPPQERFGQTLHTLGGGDIKIGSPAQVYSPGQLTAVQMAEGENAGKGLFPGGPAAQKAADAQRAAASIDGHALTPGRAVASAVFTPDTLPYNVLSGSVDFSVAMEADPAAFALGHLSEAVKEAKLFSITTPEAVASVADHVVDRFGPENAKAIQDWAGLSDHYQGAVARAGAGADLRGLVMDKLQRDPSSLRDLYSSAGIDPKEVSSAIGRSSLGLVNTFRDKFVPQNGIQFLNSERGVSTIQKMASLNGTDIWLRSGKKIDPGVAWALGSQSTEDGVRQILSDVIQNGSMRETPKVGAVVPGTGTLYAHPFADLRYVAKMPNYAVDSTNVKDMTERALQELQLGHVPSSEWDTYLKPLATAQTRTDALDGFKAIGNRIGDQILNRNKDYMAQVGELNNQRALLKRAMVDQLGLPSRTNLSGEVLADLDALGVETSKYRNLAAHTKSQEQLARQLTTYFQRVGEDDRTYWLNAQGELPHIQGFALDGELTQIDGPHGVSELLNRGIPAIGGGNDGIRLIRQATGPWAPVWRAPIVGTGLRDGAYIAGKLTNAFKIGALARLALPVRFLADEQARAASAGLVSMFRHPLDYINYVTAGKTAEDLTGQRFIDQVMERQSQYGRAIGRASTLREEISQTDQAYAKGWMRFGKGHPEYVAAWNDRLSRLYADPVGRAVAQSLVNGQPLDVVKDEFFTGRLMGARADLVNARLKWGSNQLVDRSAADSYVDSWVQRINDMTNNGDPILMDAIADGDPWRNGDKMLRSHLRDLAVTGAGPEQVVGPIALSTKKRQMFQHATNVMFSALMDTPTTTLTRSPVFRDAYFKRAQELLPHLDEGTRAQVISRAADNGIHLVDTGSAVGTKLSLEQADTLSKDFALQTTHRYLYYPGQRSNATDIIRNIIPFGEAWKNVLGTWARLVAENPAVVRRVQQGVTSARESGWWHLDPSTGKEVFTYVPGEIMKHLAGAPFPMVGQVSGLNIIGQGLPGVGPAVSWPASFVLSKWNKLPAEDAVRNWLLPYGDPDFNGGTMETLFPGWYNKIKTTGWLQKVPFFGQSADEQRVLGNVQKQVFAYKVSTGKYDWHNPQVWTKLMDDSLGDARKLYLWRGLAQFAAPAAPSYLAMAQLPNGALMEQYVIAKYFRGLLDASGGNEDQATQTFINTLGPNLVFATQPMTKTITPGLPTTTDAEAWVQDHVDFAKAYNDVYAYWAPNNGGGKFDRAAYLDQLHNGQRQALTGEQWFRAANSRVGQMIYNNKRAMLPTSPSQAQQDWLNQWKDTLTTEFPGFNQDSSTVVSKDKRDQVISQLAQAVQDKEVSSTPLAQAASEYMAKRDQALASLKAAGYSGNSLTSNAAAPLRNWLFQWGDQIAHDTPAFETMWNYIFQGEVDPNA